MDGTRFDAVAHRQDGSFALASSTLAGREWDGNLWVFKSLQDLKDCPNIYLVNTRTTSGISDLLWLSEKTLVTACDSGELEMWNCVQPGNTLELQGSLRSHDDMVLCLCRLGGVAWGGVRVVSGGADGRVIIWDVTSMKQLRNFKGHTHMVSSVATNAESADTFVTTSQDGAVRFWDLRLQNPARNIPACSRGPYTSVAWSKEKLAVGSRRGVVEVLDLRDSEFSPLSQHQIHRGSIHRMTFAPWDSHLLASVSEDTRMCVHSVLDSKVVEFKGHRDYVRGVSWHPDAGRRGLLSCGWDGQVLEHKVPHPPKRDTSSPPVAAAAAEALETAMETDCIPKQHNGHPRMENGYVTPTVSGSNEDN